MADEYLLLLNTCPDPETARRLARLLVEQRLAACVNIVPGVHSVYRWEDSIETNDEVLLLIKTRAELYPRLEQVLQREHPYAVPELVAFSVSAGLPAYLNWIDQVTA